MRRVLVGFTFAVASFAVASALPSEALTTADLECQTAIGAAARAFATKRHETIVECYNATLAGESCNAGRRDERLLKATDVLNRTVINACRKVDLHDLGFPGFCSDETFGEFVLGDLTECLEETHRSVVDFLLIPIEYPGSSQLFGSELRCQRTIARAGQTFVARKLRARATCLNEQLRRKIAAGVDCRADVAPFGGGTGDGRTDGRIIAATNDFFTRLLDACSGVTLEHLGFPGFCGDFNGGSFDLTDLRTCLHTSHEFIADDLIDIEYPPPTSNPSPTPPTPTIAITPVPTATPGNPHSVNVVFGLSSDRALEGVQMHATYPAAKGSFRGLADAVQCQISNQAGTIFIANHQDANSIVIFVVVADQVTSTTLDLPMTITCAFDLTNGQLLSSGDIVASVDEVTINGAAGDPSSLAIEVEIQSVCTQVVVSGSLDKPFAAFAAVLEYPLDVVNLRGSGTAVDGVVLDVIGGFSAVSDNDDIGDDGVDDTLHVSFVSNVDRPPGPIFTATFDCVAGQPPPTANSFTCGVLSASDAAADTIPDEVCSVEIQTIPTN